MERRPHYQVTFAVLMVAVSSYALLQSLVLPVLPTIQAGLHTTQTNVSWVLTAYLLSASIFTPILGRVGDMHGKKKVLIAALICLTLGGVLAALATNITVMIVARVIQGAGGAVLPLAFGMIRDEFPPEKVMGAIGNASSLLAVGSGAGIVLAGPLVNALNYHWLFWIPSITCAAATLATFFVIHESEQRSPGRINWIGATLMTVWLVTLLLAFSEGGEWGWGSPRIVALLVVSVVLIAVWVKAESSSANPLVDMKMMRNRSVATVNLTALLFGVGMYAVFAFLPSYLQTPKSAGYGFGSSVTQSGFFLLPMTVTMFFCGLWAGRLASRIGSKGTMVTGGAISVVPFLMLTFALDHQGAVYAASALMGIGFGFAFAAMSALIVQAVPAHQTGIATGMNANIRTIGGAIGSALMASIVTSGVAPGALPLKSGYVHGFGMLGASAIVALLAMLAVPKAAVVHEEAVALGGEPLTEDHVVHSGELALLAGGPVAEEV